MGKLILFGTTGRTDVRSARAAIDAPASGDWTPDNLNADEAGLEPDDVILRADDWQTVRLVADFAGAPTGSSSVTVQMLRAVRIEAAPGRVWMEQGSPVALTGDLASSLFTTEGADVAFRITAYTAGGATAVTLFVTGGERIVEAEITQTVTQRETAVVSVARGFADATNGFEGAANNLVGNVAGFVVGAAARLRRIPTAEEFIFSCFRQFIGTGGWALGVEAARWRIAIHQASDNAAIRNFVGGDFDDHVIGRIVVLVAVYDGTDFVLYVDGKEAATLTPASGMVVGEATAAPAIGWESRNNAQAFASGDVLGAGYGETVPTAEEVATHAVACLDGDGWADADFFSSFYDFTELDAGAAPATISDAKGSVDLARVGAITIAEITPRF